MYKILLQPLSSLKRVGPAMHKCLVRLVAQDRVFNLILHKPLRVKKISFCPRLFEVQNDELIIIKAKIESYSKPATARHPHKIICYTPTGYLSLVFFKVFPGQMEKLFVGREIAILGNLQKSSGENQIVHPQEIIDAKEIDKLPKINAIYPLTYLLTQKFLQQKNSLQMRKHSVKIKTEKVVKTKAVFDLNGNEENELFAKLKNFPGTHKTKTLIERKIEKLPLFFMSHFNKRHICNYSDKEGRYCYEN
jgi:RecG-like helicase